MKTRGALFSAVSLAALTLLAPLAANAQEQPPARPGGGGGFGGGRQGGFGRGGMMQPTLSTLPIGVLEKGLTLTADQKTKIEEIQKKAQEGMRSLFGGGGFGGGGGRPDPQAMQEMFAKMQEDRKKNDAAIEALLTDEQKKKTPALLKDVQLYQSAQLPTALIGDLKLTDDQKTKIGEIVKKIQAATQQKMQEARDNQDFQSIREIMQASQTATKTKTRELLTADQKALVEKYEKEHPNQGRGGFGGFGGGGFGGRRPGGQPGQAPPPERP